MPRRFNTAGPCLPGRDYMLPPERRYLQRVVNGGGQVEREYGVGRGRIDLLVRWPCSVGGQRRLQRHALELKLWRKGKPDPLT